MKTKPLVFAALIAIAACTSGCARKPPKSFKIDEPRVVMPVIDRADVSAAVANLPDDISGRTPTTAGIWDMAIDRKISMRSSTLAKTDIISVVGLTVKIGESGPSEDGTLTPFLIEGASVSVTATQNQDAAADNIDAGYEGLSFQVLSQPGMPLEIRGNRPVPADLQDALWAMIPILPDAATLRKGPWSISKEREVVLPGNVKAVETISGTGRVAGISAGDTVIVFDWKSQVGGSSTTDGVVGRITGGEGRGRVVCRYDRAGLKSCEASDSRTHSVSLTPSRGKRNLLQQKVLVESTLRRH